MIKLIGIDIDGTIMRKGKVHPADVKAINDAINQDIKVTIVTGRSIKSIHSVIKKLNLPSSSTPLVGQNGGQIFIINPDNEIKLIYNKVFDQNESDILFELAKKYKVKIFSYAEDEEIAYVNKKHNLFVAFMKKRSHRKAYKYKVNQKLESKISKLIVFGKKPNMFKYRQEVEKLGYPAFAFSYVSNKTSNIEVVPKGINKGNALQKVAELLNISQDEVMYFGDGENDKTAIEWAGIGVAMGNAKDDIKKIADVVTLSYDKAGVAHEINKILK